MPQISTTELDGLLRTFPLYVYFEKSLWKDIKRSENNDEIGRKLFQELKEKYQKEAFSLDQNQKMVLYKQSKKVANIQYEIKI